MPTTEPYELLGELAQGGMATVFIGRRRSRRSGRPRDLVAIKSMKQELAEDDAFATMFLDEATLTARINHPNVIRTLDVANEGGKLLIVMEYIPGVSLARLLEIGIRNHSTIPPRIVVAIVCDLLRGLHAAHELRDGNGYPLHVVHRDVSPQNVLVGSDGVSRILDFGVAKASSQRHVTMQGEIKGKLAYMPPEQAVGDVVDRRSDVYAAGVVLWESLVNRRLFTGKREEELIQQIFEGTIDPPSMVAEDEIPPAVDHVVLRALSRNRDERWSSAAEMAEHLARALAPAHYDEVAGFIAQAAHTELYQRATLVQQLELHSQPLDLESQTLQGILTSRAERGEIGDAVRGSEPSHPPPAPMPPSKVSPFAPTRSDRVRPPTPVSVPPPPSQKASRPRSPGDRSNLRREQRRKRRRMRMMLGFAVATIVIILLMTGALILGRRAREAESPQGPTPAPAPTKR